MCFQFQFELYFISFLLINFNLNVDIFHSIHLFHYIKMLLMYFDEFNCICKFISATTKYDSMGQLKVGMDNRGEDETDFGKLFSERNLHNLPSTNTNYIVA